MFGLSDISLIIFWMFSGCFLDVFWMFSLLSGGRYLDRLKEMVKNVPLLI